MDQQTEKYCIQVMDEIKAAAEELGFWSKSLEIKETSDVPTVLIGYYKNYRGEEWTVTCNVIPMNVSDKTELFTQFHLCISNDIPKEKISVLDEFVKSCNEKFMLGNLLTYQNRIYVRYSQAWEPGLALDDILFQRALAIFLRQGDVYAKLADGLIAGSTTLEAILNGSSAK